MLLTKNEIIDYLKMERDPSGLGWFKMISHDVKQGCAKCEFNCKQANSTTYSYFFENPDDALWFRLNSSMTLSYLAGAPAFVQTANTKRIKKAWVLGNDFASENVPVSLIKANRWRRISTTAEWSLISCTVSPGFEFKDIEIASSDWNPGHGKPKLVFPGAVWEAPKLRSGLSGKRNCDDFLEIKSII